MAESEGPQGVAEEKDPHELMLDTLKRHNNDLEIDNPYRQAQYKRAAPDGIPGNTIPSLGEDPLSDRKPKPVDSAPWKKPSLKPTLLAWSPQKLATGAQDPNINTPKIKTMSQSPVLSKLNCKDNMPLLLRQRLCLMSEDIDPKALTAIDSSEEVDKRMKRLDEKYGGALSRKFTNLPTENSQGFRSQHDLLPSEKPVPGNFDERRESKNAFVFRLGKSNSTLSRTMAFPVPSEQHIQEWECI
eukprot:UC4_evm1s95